ncbi:MAG: VWA domain-containing protein [Desulfurellaceae bacterium]|nr:VWA domain-containing protein [Desulfurellaceae bacterium]
MRLHDPWALVLLILIPLLFVWRWRAGYGAAVRYPSLSLLRGLPTGGRQRWRWVVPVVRGLVLVLLSLALARPQLGKAESRYVGAGIDIVLSVDISGSMRSEDFRLDGRRVSRLDVVKSVVRDFVTERPGDRIGLVLFSARPYTQCPLTLDHGWLLRNLERARIGMIEDGTAIGSALTTAVGRLEQTAAKSAVVILLTDGQNNAGKISPLTAAEAARALGIKVYTIGAGTKGMAPYPARDAFGNLVYRPVQVDIDEQTLSQIAATTGGRYFRATDTQSLRDIYQTIDQLERTTFEAPRYLDYDELYPWLLVPALVLLGLEIGLRHSLLRELP